MKKVKISLAIALLVIIMGAKFYYDESGMQGKLKLAKKIKKEESQADYKQSAKVVDGGDSRNGYLILHSEDVDGKVFDEYVVERGKDGFDVSVESLLS